MIIVIKYAKEMTIEILQNALITKWIVVILPTFFFPFGLDVAR